MKIIFFGTSQFAVPALEKIAADKNYEISAVVTQPDKPAGRKQQLLPPPVKLAAEKFGLRVLQPEKLTTDIHLTADLFVVASYGKIIPKTILDIPKHGALNIHPSLLPKYRGPSPIHAAILSGDSETGVTIMILDEQMDHGPILASQKLKVQYPRFKELHDKLAEIGSILLMQVLPKFISGSMKPQEQDHSQATFTKIIAKEDAKIDWSKSAEEIDSMIRAYAEWPVAWTTLDGKRLKIFSASPSFGDGKSKGEVELESDKIFVCCGSGRLQILELQLEGAKRMSAPEFIRGHSGLSGKILV